MWVSLVTKINHIQDNVIVTETFQTKQQNMVLRSNDENVLYQHLNTNIEI